MMGLSLLLGLVVVGRFLELCVGLKMLVLVALMSTVMVTGVMRSVGEKSSLKLEEVVVGVMIFGWRRYGDWNCVGEGWKGALRCGGRKGVVRGGGWKGVVEGMKGAVR